MLLNLVVEEDRDKVAEHKKKFGNFNDEPFGWREISSDEFAQSDFFRYTPTKFEFRQIHLKNKVINVQMFYFGDSGFAMSENYWTKKIEYYAFGCKHEWDKKDSQHMFQTNLQCKHCKQSRCYDSSG